MVKRREPTVPLSPLHHISQTVHHLTTIYNRGKEERKVPVIVSQDGKEETMSGIDRVNFVV